ncbi:thiamine transport system ATP-binding protein [Octadecabacter temperatus]|uniref:Thiamine import ATP-binding protein ThiQ n=1 Tax=Octadecabacter temperatus TaxID=1458307 RepID=A0A0K0Y9N0_9RHOB|nr:ATP-binding cassette domain-containing protein [Octadecabacter temperatus]AKS47616.1 Thiamine import ATP-binding protein ThiQ [Octadecabacter temperatus]SIO40622.1 thiamine transport system ATP-binding protein [Octadecabacter temperatus]
MLWCKDVEFLQGAYALAADLQIEAGRVTAIIGPSGAGKSTLLGGIAGFVPQTGGALLWKGSDITKLAPAKRPVSMLFQDNNLFPHLTVMQNVALALGSKLNPTASVRQRVEDMLAQVGLDGLSERKPAALSGGQQSRAALARALLQDRDVMLMDEPFSALGPGLKAEMLDLSVALAKEAGRTVVMVTHDPSDAARVADAILGVSPNKAWAPISTQDFLNDPPEAFVDYLG